MVKKSLKIRKFSFSEKEFTKKKTPMATPLIGWVLPMTVTTYTIYAVPSFLMILFEPAHYTIP
jgi:hypothetical protein